MDQAMRNRIIAGAVVGMCAVSAAPLSHGATRAQLTLVRTRPVTVDGAGFHAAERVRLDLRSPRGTGHVTVRADDGGAFTARFSADVEVRCVSFSIAAHGAAGSAARFLRRQPLSCTRT
jgi:hypothetical protein